MKLKILKSTFTALFAALICLGAVISIPLPGGVPITVQNMFAVMAGTMLGGLQGAGAVGIFLILGGLGLPVFSGMKGGIAILAGPTGGYLVGYFFGALIAGLIAGSPRISEKKTSLKNCLRTGLGAIAGFLVQYLIGVPWFINVMAGQGKNMLLSQALAFTVTPFIPGEIIKLALLIPLSLLLRPLVARYLHPDDEVDQFFQDLENKKKKAEEKNQHKTKKSDQKENLS